MKTFRHFQAKTLEEALTLLDQYRGKARINAGGTDLLGVLKDEILPVYPQALIDIKTIEGLSFIRKEEERVRIGALTRLRDIVDSHLLQQHFRVLTEAARSVASPQIRNAATLGGNLCQEVRCWYYRYPDHLGGRLNCPRKEKGACPALKGDNRYHAVLGGRKCFAVCPSDTAVALAALDAQLVLIGPKGSRKIAASDLYHPMGLNKQGDEILTEIEIPLPPEEARQDWIKFTFRKPIDFAVVSLAAIITKTDGICHEARLAFGALASFPVRAKAAEIFLQDRFLDEETAAQAAALALEGARPLSRNTYKIAIAQALIKRILLGTRDELNRRRIDLSRGYKE
jgi:xanthine dehydrogenase YagS FAD-binding subunit